MTPAVLIVDDSLTVRMDLRDAFESAGFDCVVCGNVREAREAMNARSFALAVLDVILPDGDGIELLQSIRSAPETAQMRVLLLSTEAEVRDRVRGLKMGADDYIGKPYDTSRLLAHVRQLTENMDRDDPEGNPELLVIDDSPTFREEFKAALESAGFRVVTASNGEQGVQAAVTLRPKAIIVDGVIPGGMDGTGVIRRIKQDAALRQTPCLLLTASESAGDESTALEAGADAYLRKGTELPVILARIHALLRTRLPNPLASTGLASLLSLKKILMVDDSPTYRNQLAAAMRNEGYDVIAAGSGAEALELLENQPVDCVLLDLIMPEMSGQETCGKIKSRTEWRSTPVLILTSVEDTQAMVESINAGADDYISKTSDFEVLRARVRAQLRRKQLEDEYRVIQKELADKELEATHAKAAQQLAEARAAVVDALEKKNQELEAFSFSVSHDLRAPLRAIDGFTRILLKDYSMHFPPLAQDYLARVHSSAVRMAEIIDALLQFSRLGKVEMQRTRVDLSAMGETIAAELKQSAPDRSVEFRLESRLSARADARLVRIVLSNLFGNAWKFTGRKSDARIELGAISGPNGMTFFVRDNGVGFRMAHSERMFTPFQRLHPDSEFPGNGIGLATVRRIIERHGGRVWAEGEPGQGATVYFTLGSAEVET